MIITNVYRPIYYYFAMFIFQKILEVGNNHNLIHVSIIENIKHLHSIKVHHKIHTSS